LTTRVVTNTVQISRARAVIVMN